MPRDNELTPIKLDGQSADDNRVAAVYQCRLRLQDLKETDQPDIKFCDHCQQRVFRVTDVEGFAQAVAAKRCIWTQAGWSESDQATQSSYILGKVAGVYKTTPTKLNWDN